MKGRIFAFLTALFGFLLIATFNAYASQGAPSFPSCSNPQGSTVASYPDGTHGIPGDYNTHTGADNVYSVNESQVLQCFCGGGNGIQTNWWQIGELSQGEISYWQSQGWVYIPDGSAWGLQSTPYLAYNAGYSCSNNNPNSGGNSGGGGGNPGAPVCNDTAPSGAPTITNVVYGNNSVTLTWTKAADPVSYYLIAYGTTPGNYTFGNPNVGNVLTYTINNLSGGQTYYFAVKAVHGCMPGPFSNEVPSNPTGGSVEGIADGFSVLGATDSAATNSAVSDFDSLTQSICKACLWWPMLLGEVLALVGLYLILKRRTLPFNKYLLGLIMGLAAYLAFVIVNKGNVCPTGAIGFLGLNIPCHYFWALDLIMFLLFSALIRNVKAVTPAKSPRK